MGRSPNAARRCRAPSPARRLGLKLARLAPRRSGMYNKRSVVEHGPRDWRVSGINHEGALGLTQRCRSPGPVSVVRAFLFLARRCSAKESQEQTQHVTESRTSQAKRPRHLRSPDRRRKAPAGRHRTDPVRKLHLSGSSRSSGLDLYQQIFRGLPRAPLLRRAGIHRHHRERRTRSRQAVVPLWNTPTSSRCRARR